MGMKLKESLNFTCLAFFLAAFHFEEIPCSISFLSCVEMEVQTLLRTDRGACNSKAGKYIIFSYGIVSYSSKRYKL